MTYVVAGPVENGPIIKRAEEEMLLDWIRYSDPYIPLCCARQTGKTTLMYQLRERLREDRYGVAYLYLGDSSELAANRFYETICGRILLDLSGCLDRDAVKPNVENVRDAPAFGEFIAWVASKSARCSKIVIMLDEVHGVPQPIANSFWGALRGMFTEKGVFRRVMFVLAGELDMYALATSNNSPLANVCHPFVDLKDFSADEVRTLVAAGLPASDFLVNTIYYWTSGHPYMTQKLCALVNAETNCNAKYLAEAVESKEPFKDLVEQHFLDSAEPNLLHLFKEFKAEPTYRRRVRDILKNGPMKSTPRNQDLGVLGVVKLSADRRYGIRNHIYELVLTNYLDEDYPEE